MFISTLTIVLLYRGVHFIMLGVIMAKHFELAMKLITHFMNFETFEAKSDA